ncbi:MAG: alpha/beta hydrolase [Nitriliruptoraceae bacterium]
MATMDEGAADARPVRRRLRIALWVLVGLLVAAILGFVVWASLAAPAEPGPLEAALADPAVEVTRGPVVELRPAGVEPTQGVVFYPGARVHRDAYIATWAPIVAATDTLVLIPRMPLNLAIFGRSRAADLIADTPQIDRWWVGGHSLGGAMAASWLGGQPPGAVEGLTLWASFATPGAELSSRTDLTVLSVSGTRDGLATPADLAERRELLPPTATMVEVEGMNHAQFGRYGPQRGDLEPTISDEQAQSALTQAHLAALGDAASAPQVDDPDRDPEGAAGIAPLQAPGQVSGHHRRRVAHGSARWVSDLEAGPLDTDHGEVGWQASEGGGQVERGRHPEVVRAATGGGYVLEQPPSAPVVHGAGTMTGVDGVDQHDPFGGVPQRVGQQLAGVAAHDPRHDARGAVEGPRHHGPRRVVAAVGMADTQHQHGHRRRTVRSRKWVEQEMHGS